MKNRYAESQLGYRAIFGIDWRWRLAEQLPSRSNDPLTRGSDPAVRDARGYLTLIRSGAWGRARALKIHPVIAAAHELNADATKTAPLKILVVADCSLKEIHQRLGIATEVVSAWESLFFDTRHACSSVQWLSTHVVERERSSGNTELASQLRLAIIGGRVVARALLDAESRMPMDEGQRLFDRQLKLQLKLEQAVSAPIDTNRDKLKFLKLDLDLRLRQKKLDLQRQKFVVRCEEAARRHKVAMSRREAAAQREQQRAAERAQKAEARAQHRADEERNRERMLELQRQDRLTKQQAAEARAAASPLARLKWATPVEIRSAGRPETIGIHSISMMPPVLVGGDGRQILNQLCGEAALADMLSAAPGGYIGTAAAFEPLSV